MHDQRRLNGLSRRKRLQAQSSPTLKGIVMASMNPGICSWSIVTWRCALSTETTLPFSSKRFSGARPQLIMKKQVLNTANKTQHFRIVISLILSVGLNYGR